MKIIEVTVSAARTFNHPYEDYSNLKPFRALPEFISSSPPFPTRGGVLAASPAPSAGS